MEKFLKIRCEIDLSHILVKERPFSKLPLLFLVLHLKYHELPPLCTYHCVEALFSLVVHVRMLLTSVRSNILPSLLCSPHQSVVVLLSWLRLHQPFYSLSCFILSCGWFFLRPTWFVQQPSPLAARRKALGKSSPMARCQSARTCVALTRAKLGLDFAQECPPRATHPSYIAWLALSLS